MKRQNSQNRNRGMKINPGQRHRNYFQQNNRIKFSNDAQNVYSVIKKIKDKL